MLHPRFQGQEHTRIPGRFIASLHQAYDAGELPGATLNEGVLLTAAESAEMGVRNRVQVALPDLTLYAERLAPDRFAGSYMDQKGGGLAVVVYTDDATFRLAALKRAFPFPDRIRLTRAPHTLTELSRLQDQISKEMPTLQAAGIPIGMVGVNEEKNLVDVRLYGSVTAQVTDALRTRYPADKIVVSSEQPLRPRSSEYQDAPPLRGGQWIINQTEHVTELLIGLCTSAFVGFKRTVVGGVTVNLPRLLTAGHCGKANTAWTQGLTYAIGNMERSVDGGKTDAGSIVIQGVTNWAPEILVDTGARYHLPIKQVQPVNTIALNTSVCHYGTYGGYHCGLVDYKGTATYQDPYTGAQTTLTEQVCHAAHSQGGDSGGPIFQNLGTLGPYQADGILAGGDAVDTCWSQIGNALPALQLDGLFTA